MQKRSLQLILGGVAVGVPTVAWFVRRASGKRHEKFARESVEDFTAEQTAFLQRVREIWDAIGAQAPADLQHTTS